MAPRIRFKPLSMAIGLAAIVMVGTVTGAQLKADKQANERFTEFRSLSYAEQISELEARRAKLEEMRRQMQAKLDDFVARSTERRRQQHGPGDS